MKSREYTFSQLILLTALRVSIGWHLMYEGLVKVFQPSWTSYGYLMDSKGWFAPMFKSLAANPTLLEIADFLNVWGLTLVGLSLILGLLSRWAKIGAVIMLLFYFLSHPPLMNVTYLFPGEGSYLWINKNLIELLAVAVLFAFPTGHILGLDRLINNYRKN